MRIYNHFADIFFLSSYYRNARLSGIIGTKSRISSKHYDLTLYRKKSRKKTFPVKNRNTMSPPLRLVLDTNIWLDWLRFKDPCVEGIKKSIEQQRACIYLSKSTKAELERVLDYPMPRFALTHEEKINAIQVQLRYAIDWEVEAPLPIPDYPLPRCTDPDDQMFLELARHCSADALITKDRALLILNKKKRYPLPFLIVTPEQWDRHLLHLDSSTRISG